MVGVLVDSLLADSLLADEEDSDDVVLAVVVLEAVVFVTDELGAAAPAAAVPVTPDAHAVNDAIDRREMPARTALMDERMMLFSQ